MTAPAEGDAPTETVAPERVIVAADRCKGCALCVAVCPIEIMELGSLNRLGYAVARVADQARCTSCAVCALVCPDMAITVRRPRKVRQSQESRP